MKGLVPDYECKYYGDCGDGTYLKIAAFMIIYWITYLLFAKKMDIDNPFINMFFMLVAPMIAIVVVASLLY